MIRDGRDAVEKQDDERVQRILENLEKEAHRLASKLYENAGDGSAGNGAPSGGPSTTRGRDGHKPKDDVIDAEFEETGRGESA